MRELMKKESSLTNKSPVTTSEVKKKIKGVNWSSIADELVQNTFMQLILVEYYQVNIFFL